jgi:putative transposase
MPAKRFTVEQIIAKLREAEKLQADGVTIPQTCKKLQISDQTFYRWRLPYGALKEGEAQRLTGKILSPARRRDAVAYLRHLARAEPGSSRHRAHLSEPFVRSQRRPAGV